MEKTNKGESKMEKTKDVKKSSTGRVKADNARIDRLKEQLRSTPKDVDFERVRIMAEVYEDTVGDQQILRRAKFFALATEEDGWLVEHHAPRYITD